MYVYHNLIQNHRDHTDINIGRCGRWRWRCVCTQLYLLPNTRISPNIRFSNAESNIVLLMLIQSPNNTCRHMIFPTPISVRSTSSKQIWLLPRTSPSMPTRISKLKLLPGNNIKQNCHLNVICNKCHKLFSNVDILTVSLLLTYGLAMPQTCVVFDIDIWNLMKWLYKVLKRSILKVRNWSYTSD